MKYLWGILLLTFVFACKKEKEAEVQTPDPSQPKVIILNEGNFRSANASMDIYYPHDHSIQENIYSSNNQNRPLGDVAQSMSLIKGEYWVVMNNSNKIEILDPETFVSKGKVSGFNSPRYAVAYKNKVYVSDLYEDVIYVVDPNSRQIVKRIATQGWTEEMLVHDDKLFVCQVDSNQLLVYDAEQDSLIVKLPTYRSPTSMVLDQFNRLWVGCTGGINESDPAIMQFDTDSLILRSYHSTMNNSRRFSDLSVSPNGDKLYFIDDDIYQVDVYENYFSVNKLIDQNNRNFYALEVDPFSGDLYISDALDYQQRGQVYRYSSSGTLLHSFKAGLIPGFFYFEN